LRSKGGRGEGEKGKVGEEMDEVVGGLRFWRDDFILDVGQRVIVVV